MRCTMNGRVERMKHSEKQRDVRTAVRTVNDTGGYAERMKCTMNGRVERRSV